MKTETYLPIIQSIIFNGTIGSLLKYLNLFALNYENLYITTVFSTIFWQKCDATMGVLFLTHASQG